MTAFSFDASETPRCPTVHTSWEYDDDTDDKVASTTVCGDPVRLLVAAQLEIGPGEVVIMDQIGKLADSFSWEVVCDRGHILAVSDGEETAEDFTWDTVFGPQP